MKSIEELKNIIIQGDCLEVMKEIPDGSIDLVVTDPPYNMAYSGRGKINSFVGFKNDDIDEEKHTEWFGYVVKDLYRVLKDNTSIYVWIDFRNYARFYNIIKKYFIIKNCIVWDKKSIGLGQSYRFQHEFCIYAVKGKPILNFEKKNVSDVWTLNRDTSSEYKHPTQKPISAMYLPIQYSSQRGG